MPTRFIRSPKPSYPGSLTQVPNPTERNTYQALNRLRRNVEVIFATSGSAVAAKEIEVNFGSIPTRSLVVTVADPDVSITSHVLVGQSGNTPTGKMADEVEMDAIQYRIRPANGSFTLYGTALEGPVVGAFKLNYLIG